jgi:flagellar biogenesis protein FliO
MLAFLLQAQARSPESELTSVNNEIFDYVRLVVVLLAVVALAFFALRFVLPRMKGLQRMSSGPIRIAARFTLEPGKTLYVVNAGPEYFLVGTSESGIHYLTALNPEGMEAALEQVKQPGGEADFAKVLKAFRRPHGSP